MLVSPTQHINRLTQHIHTVATQAWLHAIRYGELKTFEHMIGEGDRVLEIGGGTGWLARSLSKQGRSIVSVDLADSLYRGDRIHDIIEYDGRTLPFSDGEFDMCFSSHVLEHVVSLADLQKEMARVLGDSGSALHVVPTPWWLLLNWVLHYPYMAHKTLIEPILRWSRSSAGASAGDGNGEGGGQNERDADGLPDDLAALARCLPRPEPWVRPEGLPEEGVAKLMRMLRSGVAPRRHGERGTVLTEPLYYRPAWWRRHFRRHGWTVLADFPVRVFNVGLFRTRLGLSARSKLSYVLGPSSWAFHVAPPSG